MLRIAAPKWLGTGARLFALPFELAQSKSLAKARNLFAGSQGVAHGMLRAGTPGALASHCVPVLTFRASRSKPLQPSPNVVGNGGARDEKCGRARKTSKSR
jgi:hypothetical protein